MKLNPIIKFLLFVLALSITPISVAKFSEKEQKHLEDLAEKNPQDALTYIAQKLETADKSSDLYLDYLDAKASILSTVYNQIELEKVLEEAIPLSLNHSDKRYYASFLLYKAILEQTKGRYDEAQQFIEQAQQEADKSIKGEREDSLLLGNIYSAKGRTHYYAGNFEEAAVAWKHSYNFYEQGNYEKLKMIIVNDLGNLAVSMGDYQSAINNFKEVIAFHKKNNMEMATGPSIFNLGLNYVYTKQPEKAKEYFLEAIAIGKKYNDILTQAHATEWLGQVESDLKNVELAETHFKNALNLFSHVKNEPKIFTIRLRLARLYINNKNLRKSAQLIEEAKTQLDTLQQDMLKNEINRIEGSLFEAHEDYANAVKLYKDYHNNYRKFVEETNQKTIIEMKSKFSSERQKAQTALLEKELALEKAQAESELQEKQKVQGLLALAIAAIISLLFFYHRQRKLKQKLAFLALTDELTGVDNRRAIFKKALEQFNSSKRYNTALTVGVCDLDHFKNLNDTYGHDVGDEVLKAFAKASKSSIRNVDHFGRIGGEEWLFVFPSTCSDGIAKIVERINKHMQDAKLPVDKTPTFSMGTAEVCEDDQDIAQVIKRADDGLYKAKEQGRNRIVHV